MPRKTNKKAAPRWRRQRKRWLIVLAVMGVFSAVGLLWLRSALDSAERRSAEKRESLIEAGVLEATPHSPSQASEKAPEERPREVVIELDGEMPELVKELLGDYGFPGPIRWDTLDAETQAAVRRYLESQSAALEALHTGLWRLYAPALSPNTPHVTTDETATETLEEKLQLLQLEALLAAGEGDSERAASALIVAMAEIESLSASGLQWTAEAQSWYLMHFTEIFQDAVSMGVYSAADLDTLQGAFQAAYEPEQLIQSAGHYFRWGLELYQRPTDFVDDIGQHGLERWAPGITQLMLTTSDFSGWNTLDRPRYYDHMEQVIALTQLPFPERISSLRQFREEMRSAHLSGLRFSYIIPHLFCFTVSSHWQMQILMESAATTAAIEGYRLETGLFPENLAALAPDHLAELPLDPFNGQTLRYATTETGYSVYSVGRNRIDDDGDPDGDQVFTVIHESAEKNLNLAAQAAVK